MSRAIELENGNSNVRVNVAINPASEEGDKSIYKKYPLHSVNWGADHVPGSWGPDAQKVTNENRQRALEKEKERREVSLEADAVVQALSEGEILFKSMTDDLVREKIKKPDPHWESVPAYDKGEGDKERLIGYQVRWSEPDEEGRYLWVGHYYADDDGSNIGWCEMASRSQAARFNSIKKLTSEFPAMQVTTKDQTQEERNTFDEAQRSELPEGEGDD